MKKDSNIKMTKNLTRILLLFILIFSISSSVFAKDFVINNVSNSNQHYFHVDGSSGNIGIGVSTPNSSLVVSSSRISSNDGGIKLVDSEDSGNERVHLGLTTSAGDGFLSIYDSSENEQIKFHTNGLSYLGSSSARLSIGHTSLPSNGMRVEISGDLGATQYCDEDGLNCFTYSNFSGGLDGSGSAGNLSYFSDSNTLTSSQLYESSGNIGIGTNSPGSALVVSSSRISSNDGGIKLVDSEDSGNERVHLGLTTSAGDGFLSIYDSSENEQIKFHTNGLSYLGSSSARLSIGHTSLPSNGMRVEISGDLGATQYCDEDGLNCFTYSNFSGGLDGSGTVNYLPYFSDSDTLADSELTYTIPSGSHRILAFNNDNPNLIDNSGVVFSVHNPVTGFNPSGIKISNNNTGSETGDGFDIYVDNAGIARVWFNENDEILFGTNDAEVMRIESDGRVGINDTIPDGTLLLDVEGQVGATEYCDEDGLNCFTYGNFSGGIDGSGTGNYIPYFSDSDTLADSTIYTDGTNIGIGTTNPNGTLHIAEGTVGLTANPAADNFVIEQSGSGAGMSFFSDSVLGSLIFGTTGSTFGGSEQAFDGAIQYDHFFDSFVFYIDGNDFVRFDSDAVGIGDTSPDGSLVLDVDGNIGGDQFCDSDGNNCFLPTAVGSGVGGSGTANYLPYFSDSDTLADSTIYTDGTNIGIGTTTLTGDLSLDTDSGVEFAFVGSASGNIQSYTGTDFYIGTSDASKLRLRANDVDRLTISSEGYVGINDTTPGFELDVTGDAHIKNRLAVGDSSPSDFYGIRVNEVQTDTSTTATMGIRIDSDITTTLTGSKNHYGSYVLSDAQINQNGNLGSLYGTYNLVRNDPSSEGDNLTNLFAISGHAQARGSGTVTSVRGGDFDVSTEDSTASITTAYGVDSLVHSDAAGSITNAYGGYFRVLDEGGMSNAYGVYSRVYESGGDITIGNALYADCDDATTCYGLQIVAGDAEVVTDWGIYESGADKNYFSAPLGIADSVPDGSLLLDVEGQIGATEYCDEDGLNCFTSGNFSGFVDGSGNSGNISYFSDSDTLTSSQLYESSGNIGIGTNSPGSALVVSSSRISSNDGGIKLVDSEDSNNERIHLGLTTGGGHGFLSIYDGSENEQIKFHTNGLSYLGSSSARLSVGHTSLPSNGMRVEISGNIGATEYCDEDGLNCFESSEVSGGIASADYDSGWTLLSSGTSSVDLSHDLNSQFFSNVMIYGSCGTNTSRPMLAMGTTSSGGGAYGYDIAFINSSSARILTRASGGSHFEGGCGASSYFRLYLWE